MKSWIKNSSEACTVRSSKAGSSPACRIWVPVVVCCAVLAAAGIIPLQCDVLTSVAFAGMINMEFKFTPYVGDPKADEVETVAGKAQVFLNNVPVNDQDVDKKKVPVLFESRDISPAVWVPASTLGPGLRKGKNKIRFEFEPADGKTAYQAVLSWAGVTDGVTSESKPGKYSATNQAGEGRETKKAKGKVMLEREFIADFAADLAWHHYPAVAAVTDADKQKIAALLKARAEAFKPNFENVYALLKGRDGVDLAEIRKGKFLDAAYAAGVRIAAPAPAELDFVVTGNPEVMVRRRSGQLFPLETQPFDKIKDQEKQMGAGMTLFAVYPPQLAVVRTPKGDWEIVY